MSIHGSSISNVPTNSSDKENNNTPIKLIDTTNPAEQSDSENEFSRQSTGGSSGWRKLAKKPTNFSMREGLARRKYAKWQQDTRQTPPFSVSSSKKPGDAATTPLSPSQVTLESTTPSSAAEVEQADFAEPYTSQPERGRDTARRTSPERPKTPKHPPHSEVDILYENQRGSFFFGVPLYSHSSLLNFDPSAWVTSDFKPSPVNITNAQLPDPSWEWSWKSWYVDMSADVDEEGWQYSFSFAGRFSWHGTHPWWTSFVRRRRWLRKRVKRHAVHGVKEEGHKLTSDYFTIHTKRERSVSTDRGTDARYSWISQGLSAKEEGVLLEDITDVPSLMRALRLATIDREKMDAVKLFVEHGGDELALLAEQVPTILSFLVFNTSKKRLSEYFKKAAHDAEISAGQEQVENDESDDMNAEKQRRRQQVDNLHKAIKIMERELGPSIEIWSDRRPAIRTFESSDSHIHPSGAHEETDPIGTIKGIPSKANLGVEPTINPSSPPPVLSEPFGRDGSQDFREAKGKEKEESDGKGKQDDGGEIHSLASTISSTHLPRDTVVVPDK